MSGALNNFKLFITYLNKNNIHYAILGRSTSLEEVIEGDIDLVLSIENFEKVEQLVDVFCAENNTSFIQNIQHERTSKYIIISDDSDHSIICPDICSHYIRNKRLLIKNSDLLQNTKPLSVDGFDIHVLNPEYEFLYYLLKKIDKSKLNNLEFNHLGEQFKMSSKKVLINLLSRCFSEDTVAKIVEIFNQKDVEALIGLTPNFRKELHQRSPIKLTSFYKDSILKGKRVLNRTGLSIAIMGPDGCGKSTVINSILENLSAAFRETDYYHLKPIKSNSTIVVVDPQGQKPYSFFKSIVKLVYLIYQYNFGFVRVRMQMIKSTFIVFDRYFEDLLVDNLRFRYGAPKIFAKIALIFIPKPQLYIFLDGPGEVIYKRKQELSIEEINRQRVEYLSLFKGKENHFVVDATQNEEAVVFDVERIILKHLETRQKNRIY